MRRRVLVQLLVAILALVAGAAWLVARLTPPPRIRPRVEVVEPPVRPLPPPPPLALEQPPAPEPEERPVTPPEAKDPAEAHRLELLIERRAAYRSLRDGFSGPASTAPLVRLEPALRALWPGDPPPWQASCRGRICRVTGPGERAAWHERLLADAGVDAVTDRISVDPDGVEPQAYLFVTDAPPGSGEDFLATVEDRIRASPGLEACQKGLEAAVHVELLVDESGLTFRPSGEGSPESLRCLGVSIGEVVGLVQVPASTKAASRTVAFEPIR